MQAEPITERAQRLFAGLGSGYDRWSSWLSFGQDPRWRRFMVSRVQVPSSAHVLDVACGTGLVVRELHRRYGCRITALDQSAGMLAAARERTASLGADVTLVEGRAEALPFADATFDGLTFTYLLRYVDDVDATLRELARVVRPGAPVGYLEFAVPPRAPTRALWHLYTGVGLPLAGRLIDPAWHDVGRFLRPSILRFAERYPPPALQAAFERAGFTDVRFRLMSFGGGVIVWGRRAR